jgi:crotonobetainyl-CoA:carnitine CoA-transferase CaiB-like acyl-CoA transferase
VVDVCLLDSALTMVEIPTSYYLATGEEGGEAGRPPYRAKDGWVVISAAGRDMAGRLMRLVAGDDAAADPGPMNSSVDGADERRRRLTAWCAGRTVAEIVAALLDAGVPVAPVRGIPEVAQDPHLWEREMLVKMPDAVAGELYLPGATVKLSRTPGKPGPVPTPGQHTDELLERLLGYGRAKLAALRSAKVIA